MTIWTPKTPGGIRSHWAPETSGAWKESNILVYSTQIKQERLIHLENVYRYMHHYLQEEGWRSPSGDFWFEDFYGEYRDQEGHKEIRYWWRVNKSPGGIFGKHQYFKQSLYIDVLTTNMKRVEIMYKGKKIKPYVGEFIVWINAVLEMDINGWFSGGKAPPYDKPHGVLGILEDFFPRMIYKQRVREQEVELRRIAERLVEDLKFYIGLNRSAEVRKPMDAEKQWF